MDNTNELTAYEQGALVLWLLYQQPMATEEIAKRVGLRKQRVDEMLTRCSADMPLEYDGEFWRIRQSS